MLKTTMVVVYFYHNPLEFPEGLLVDLLRVLFLGTPCLTSWLRNGYVMGLPPFGHHYGFLEYLEIFPH